MTVPVSNLLIKNYAPGKWHFTHNPNSGQKEGNKHLSWMDRSFPKYGFGCAVHLVDANGDEITRILLSHSMPLYDRHAQRSTAGNLWEQDVFAFIHQPSSSSQLFAVIVPWWGKDGRLVVDLVRHTVLSHEHYDWAEIEDSYKGRIKQGITEMVTAISANKEGHLEKGERSEAAEQYSSKDAIIHHAGILQMAELEAALRTLRAAGAMRQDPFNAIGRKATMALHRLGFDEEEEFRIAAANGEVARMNVLISMGVDVNWGRKTIYSVSNVDNSSETALHCAVENMSADAVKLLLKTEGIDVNAQNSEGETPLFMASSPEVLDLLLEDSRTKLDAKDRHYRAAIHKFCTFYEKPLVEKLLGRMVDKNLSFYGRGTCLHLACSAGRHDLVSLLLNSGCDINAKTSHSKTPLYVAVEAGSSAVVKILLEHEGVDLNTRPLDKYRHNAQPDDPVLCLAIKRGHMEIVKFLLEYPGLDSSSVLGPALLVAIEEDNESKGGIVKLLLEHPGLDASSMLEPALVAAVKQDSTRMVSMLLAHELSDASCLRAALVAASGNGNLQMAKFLLGHAKMEPEVCVYDALDAACPPNHLEVVELLLGAADVNCWTGGGSAVYDAAKREESAKLLELLINSGADPNYKDKTTGWTALTVLLDQAGSHGRIRTLLEAGADPNALDNKGWSPLHWACQLGDPIIVTMLLEKGGNSDMKTEKGQTALDIARSRNQLDVIRLLVIRLTDEIQDTTISLPPSSSPRNH